jgi:PAS domain S-box-containing protein
LSVVVACASAYTALDLTGPAAHASTPRRSLAWTFAGTAALAIGVWSMHFVGMQAFHIPLRLEYDVVIVAASFVLAFAGAMVSLWWLVKNAANRAVLFGASVFLGCCLAGMHYTGMAALSIPAAIRYDPAWVAISVIIATATSYAAFRLAGTFASRDDLRRFGPKAWTALALGIAIVSVHYTGMAGAHFYPVGRESMNMSRSGEVDQTTLGVVVAVAALVILGLFVLSAYINTRLRLKEREQAHFRLLADSAPNMIWTLDEGGVVNYFNPRLVEYTGFNAGETPLRDMREIVHPDDRATMSERWNEAVSNKTMYRDELRLRSAAGTYCWHLVQALPVRDESGSIVQWIGSSSDIHEQKQASETAHFLEEAGRKLNSSLDLHQSLTQIAGMSRKYADRCEIHYRDARQEVRAVCSGTIAEPCEPFVWDVSLEEQGDVGRLRLLRMPDKGPFTEAERGLFEHLALRLSAAIATMNLYQREHRVAQSFQQASLPEALPEVAGLVFDAVYVPGSEDANIGGDWYDAVRLLDGRIVLSIGDVAGSGLEAAITMGNVRQIIRGIAQVHADPGLMLDAVDRALRIESGDRFVTAFVGVVDPVAETLSYASAGHPPPMLRSPDGSVHILEDGGLPLGLRHNRIAGSARVVRFSPGCMLVMYTDGLTEERRDPFDGERRLHAIVSEAESLSGDRPAEAIKRAVLQGRSAHDDIAILVVHATQRPSVKRWTLDVRDASAAQAMRRTLAAVLSSRDRGNAEIAAAEIVLGELLGNAARYAPGPVDVAVDWSGEAPVLHVLDNGPGFRHIPILPDVFSESGRGLYIVSMLTQDFHVSRRADGGSHARAVLAPAYGGLVVNARPALFDLLAR